MVATDNTSPNISSTTPLGALTLAAMALPGLLMQNAQAQEPTSLSVQYAHYDEALRDLGGLPSKFKPLNADSLLGQINFNVNDDWQATVSFAQDTWSGATPVATAPVSAHGNRNSATHVMTGASIDHGGHGDHGEGTDPDTPAEPQALTGASPYLFTSLKLDANRRPLMKDEEGHITGGVDDQLVHTLSSASPEVRQQVDLSARRQWDERSLGVGIGASHERDFSSHYAHVASGWDFNKKQSTLLVSASVTQSTTEALLDHDAVPHIYEPYMFTYERRGDPSYNNRHRSSQLKLGEHAPTLIGDRDDWSMTVGWTQILSKTALLESSLGYTDSTGYLANPYKAVEVAFIDPLLQAGQAGGNTAADYVYDAQLVALMEQRPDQRHQTVLNWRYVQYIDRSDAALHLSYRYFRDSWSITAHTLEAEWVQPLGDSWTITPRLRYYTQSAAAFYTPYLITEQGLFSYVTDSEHGDLLLDTRHTDSNTRYYEDHSGSVTPPIDSNPDSPHFGLPIVGPNGHAVINRDTGLVVNDFFLVDALKRDTIPFDYGLLPRYYSSDTRLSGFGTLSVGLTLVKTLIPGVTFEIGYERSEHAGHLKWGGGGEANYADFGSEHFNLALTVNWDALASRPSTTSHSHHHDSAGPSHLVIPAGVQAGHVLTNRDDMMIAYRFMQSEQHGDMLHKGKSASDFDIINNGCDNHPCYVRATDMTMRMHMLDIMFASSESLTWMLMPQFVDMSMAMRLLDESPRTGGMDAIGSALMHSEHRHTTAGLGDTEVQAMMNVHNDRSSAIHLGMGISVPTGSVTQTMRPMMGNVLGFYEYGMQLGSGTWDAKPSITYTHHGEVLQWGAQVAATLRLTDHNRSGYALGDVWQATAWLGYALSDKVSVSLRAQFSTQQTIKGEYDDTHVPIGPGDYAVNYGGDFADVGIGFSANLGNSASRVSVEWLQPVVDEPNGYQLERHGSFVLNWSTHL